METNSNCHYIYGWFDTNTKEYKEKMSKIKRACVNPMKDPEIVKKCFESRLRNLNNAKIKKEGDF